MGYLSQEEVDRHYYFFGEMPGIDLHIPDTMMTDGIMEKIYANSRMAKKGVRYILLERIGRCVSFNDEYRVAAGLGLVRDVLCEHNALVEARMGKEEEVFYDKSLVQCGSPA